MSQQTHFWLAAEDCSKFLSYRGPVNGTVAFEIPFHEIKILTFTMAYLYSKSSAPDQSPTFQTLNSCNLTLLT